MSLLGDFTVGSQLQMETALIGMKSWQPSLEPPWNRCLSYCEDSGKGRGWEDAHKEIKTSKNA